MPSDNTVISHYDIRNLEAWNGRSSLLQARRGEGNEEIPVVDLRANFLSGPLIVMG